ncbi:hypothetical protein, partial [Arthrobacter sp. DR-2P]
CTTSQPTRTCRSPPWSGGLELKKRVLGLAPSIPETTR